MRPDLTQDQLKQVLHYDPDTGAFTWLRSGLVAGRARGGRGRVRITIDGQQYKAHRLAFLYMTGRWPVDQIDHINRDNSDNRWVNLREATSSQNRVNIIKPYASKWGRGVRPCKKGFSAHISISGVQVQLGHYKTQLEAQCAYDEAAIKQFGEFAITNKYLRENKS